jgi:hypothetical protein
MLLVLHQAVWPQQLLCLQQLSIVALATNCDNDKQNNGGESISYSSDALATRTHREKSHAAHACSPVATVVSDMRACSTCPLSQLLYKL